MDTTTESPQVSGASVELFTLSMVGTLIILVGLMVRLSWKRLRATVIEPADAPIAVE